MTEFGSVRPHLLSLTNSRFLAVPWRPPQLGFRWGEGRGGLYRSTRFTSGPPDRRSLADTLNIAALAREFHVETDVYNASGRPRYRNWLKPEGSSSLPGVIPRLP